MFSLALGAKEKNMFFMSEHWFRDFGMSDRAGVWSNQEEMDKL